MRLLIVDDEPDLVGALRYGLEQAGYAVDTALTGADAEQRLAANAYDLVVLDLNLPDRDGLALCRDLRAGADGHTPREVRILMLTARSSLPARVAGLDAGADDYLVKPFGMPELLARVRALLRRDAGGRSAEIAVGDLLLDPASRRAWRSDRELRLTNKEFGLLEYLLGRPGVVVSAEDLLEHVWDENADPFTQTVRVTVGTLRRKLAVVGERAVIETVVGRGYRLVEPR